MDTHSGSLKSDMVQWTGKQSFPNTVRLPTNLLPSCVKMKIYQSEITAYRWMLENPKYNKK